MDSNIVIASLNDNPQVVERLGELAPDEVVLCTPVLAELIFGAHCSSRKDENLAKVQELASRMRYEAFGVAAARTFGEVKALLRKKGVTKSDFDLAIASIALGAGAILVTDDQALHDGSIPALEVENWLT